MRVGIYHLVRKVNGLEPYRAFLRSLRQAPPPPGTDWRLVLIFKGFDGTGDTRAYLDEAHGLPVQPLCISDAGVDISSYFHAAAVTDFDVLVFFNSFSEIVEPRWFELMAQALAPDVGLVGATGSLESVVRNHVLYGQRADTVPRKAGKYALAAGLLALFPPFPNPHVRTNAFMIRRAHFLASRTFPVQRRLAALVYESGWLSLTRRIQRMGLRVLVVTRDGAALPPEAWADARGFRSGAQDNVIVTDNRIREYAEATPERQDVLRELAFGDQRSRS